jgi:hypothetical protein
MSILDLEKKSEKKKQEKTEEIITYNVYQKNLYNKYKFHTMESEKKFAYRFYQK